MCKVISYIAGVDLFIGILGMDSTDDKSFLVACTMILIGCALLIGVHGTQSTRA